MLIRIFISDNFFKLQQDLRDWLNEKQPTISNYELDTVDDKFIMIVSYVILPEEPIYQAWPGGISASALIAS